MKFSSTFIYEVAQLDDEFHRLDDEIASRARLIAGFLGEENWENEDAGLYCQVYYWSSMEALKQLIEMDTHGLAKNLHGNWLGAYRVVISEIHSVYGDSSLGLFHQPPSPEPAT